MIRELGGVIVAAVVILALALRRLTVVARARAVLADLERLTAGDDGESM